MYWIQFAISTVCIVAAGVRLTRYADKLSEHYHVGKAWIGIVLLGGVTSLPEAVTTFVAVTQLRAADLAVGNILGSNAFNPMLVVMMDLLYRRCAVTNMIEPKQEHHVSALLASLLAMIVFAEIFISSRWPIPSIGSVSLVNVVIIAVYIFGVRYLARLSRENTAHALELVTDKLSVIWINIVVSAAVVVGGSIILAQSSDTIAAVTGLGRTFVGTVFLAITTSLPEVVVTIASLRIGVFDLAIGNIFGSNMINIFILAICSLFYKGQPLLAVVSKTHLFTILLSVLLTHTIMTGMQYRNKRVFFGMGIDSWLMTAFFFFGIGFLYVVR